jgi:protein TonB
MTHSRPIIVATLSANDAFKLQYPRYLKGAVLIALALTALLVWLWPGYEAKPYALRKTEVLELIVLEPAPLVVEPPKPIVVPRLPPVVEAAPEDDPDAVDTIPDLIPITTRINDVTYLPPSDEGFIPSSTEPVITFQMKADYPEIARRARLEGTVLIHARVNARGQVERAEIIQGVHPLLDKAALAAALRCRFTPAKQRTVSVPVWVAIPYRFRLH